MHKQDNNTNEIILTIILVTYNHVKTISQTIESILSQNVNFKYVIYLCDDCSTDGTTEICQRYADKYPALIEFFPQTQNTFNAKSENNHVVRAYKRIKTKYFCLMEGDDRYCDDDFFQVAIDTLDEKPEYYIFGANTNIRDFISNSEHNLINNDKLSEFSLNQLNKDEFVFIFSQSRVYRNTFTDFPQGDILMYLYHLAFGPVYYYNKVVAIYNRTGSGVWTSLPDSIMQKTGDMVPYRMLQVFDFEHMDNWVGLHKEETFERLLFWSKFLGIRRAWHLWFYITFIPTFGIEFFDINYGNLKNKSKQNYFEHLKILIKILLNKKFY